MRRTIGYTPRTRRWRPCDSFAYAGGEITPRKLPGDLPVGTVPDVGGVKTSEPNDSKRTPADPTRVGTLSERSESKGAAVPPTPNPVPLQPGKPDALQAPKKVALPAGQIEAQMMNNPIQIEPACPEPIPTPPEPPPTQTTAIVPVQTTQAPADAQRFLGGRSFSSDIEPALSSGALAPEVPITSEAPETSRHRAKPRRRKPSPASAARQRTAKSAIRVALPTHIAVKSREEGDISLNHHEAHCTICRHPERDAIEQAFLRWWRPVDLAIQFNLGHKMVVYRHAHAFRLFERRLAKTRHSLEYVVEKAQSVNPTAESIIRAVRALSCLDDDGHWTEPPKRVIITHEFLDTRIEKKLA